ncbi:hypothetical protein [Siphonobacter sp. SORGH_AS_1065]|uniref:hypothetical protein n=1 Tax=Siphonobacter sp. SORGH_AS_1065 TaxID=3041795 RepID=UPI002784C28F|nr:hypothetical protein [Siphonobacter sp. SORGH_AS_1065]MDQ1087444.1 hypothetical protein [Siphonobacter sp. SORGH_AS_1065]
MNLIQFIIKTDNIINNNIILSDIIRNNIYEQYPKISNLDYNNRSIFLEPSIFYYFMSNTEDKISIFQSLIGYIFPNKFTFPIQLTSDRYGLINIPNLGYIRYNQKNNSLYSHLDVSSSLIPNQFIFNSKIRICLDCSNQLSIGNKINLSESPELTINKNINVLNKSVIFLQEYLPIFWHLIELVTNEFVVFNSTNKNSFASIIHHGTAYFNTEGKLQTPIFFIDDISHQCGHIIFNVLTLKSNDFLKVPKDYPLNKFTGNSYDRRNVYGAFHGLFTYTTILYSLDTVLSTDNHELDKIEALGRLGFYLSKFQLDLINLNNPAILTEQGMDYHHQFQLGYTYIVNKYANQIAGLNYSNQPYTYQHDLFILANSKIHTSLY